MGFSFAARMRQRAFFGRAYSLCIFPDCPRIIVGSARLPCGAALGKFGLVKIDLDRASFGVNGDGVTILQ